MVRVSLPITAAPTSKPGTASSTITSLSCSNAISRASISLSISVTFVIPKEEPARRGFTNRGRASISLISSNAPSLSKPWKARDLGTLIPLWLTSLWALSLSMQRAEDRVLHPTTGMPAISNIPWILPSSPFFPCSTGNTMSTSVTPVTFPVFPENSKKPFCRGPWENTTGIIFFSSSCQVSSPIFSVSPVQRYHSPFLVIPIGMIWYFSLFIWVRTAEADWSDTSYSVDLPPKITAIFFFISYPSFFFKTKTSL